MTNNVKQEELIRQGIFDYNMNTTVAGMTEEKGMDVTVRYFKYLINQQVIQALESLRIVKQGKTYSDATDWKHEVELQEEELSRLIKEYKGE